MLRLNINSHDEANKIAEKQSDNPRYRWVMVDKVPSTTNLNWAEYHNITPFAPIKWAKSDQYPYFDMLTIRGCHRDYPLSRWVSHINALLPSCMTVTLRKHRAFLLFTQLNVTKRFILPQWDGDCYKAELVLYKKDVWEWYDEPKQEVITYDKINLYKKDVWQWYDEPKQEVIAQDKELKQTLTPWYNRLKENAAAWGAVYDGLESEGFDRALQDYIKETKRPEFSEDGRLCYSVPNSPATRTVIHAEYPDTWGPLCNEVLQDPEHKLYFILVWVYRRERVRGITMFIYTRIIKAYSAEALWE
jgi:hypothetical protein